MNLIRFLSKRLNSLICKRDLKKIKVFISKNVEFSNSTFEGKNNIGARTNVSNSDVGYGTYIGNNCVLNLCKIGKFCSLANGIKILKNNHPTSFFSTHPAFHRPSSSLIKKLKLDLVSEDKFPEFQLLDHKYQVCIDSDVWVGEDVKIITGVCIGQGAVIAAGTVVTKDIPPYAIVAGVPARIIRYRFDPETVNSIMNIDFWSSPIEIIERYAEVMESPLVLLKKINDNSKKHHATSSSKNN